LQPQIFSRRHSDDVLEVASQVALVAEAHLHRDGGDRKAVPQKPLGVSDTQQRLVLVRRESCRGAKGSQQGEGADTSQAAQVFQADILHEFLSR
jgi:hypothetical protein